MRISEKCKTFTVLIIDVLVMELANGIHESITFYQ